MSSLYTGAVKFAYIAVFAIMAAVSTLLIWVVHTLPGPEPFAIDALAYWPMVSGVSGPVLTMLLIYRATRSVEISRRHMLRWTCVVGASLVLLLEFAYLTVLGILNMAYSGVQM